MPRSAKEQVDITALLQGILNGYPGNTAIFREYLQNSDDAKATKQAGPIHTHVTGVDAQRPVSV